MQVSDTYVRKLTAAGLRVTPARREILAVLEAAPDALTISELTARTDVDQATVYRNLKPLLAAGVLEGVSVSPTETRYALTHHHHDHAICTACGAIEHIPCTNPALPRTKTFANIDHHAVTYYGTCVTCTSSSAV